MITACGYTSKFNQATLGTSSRGAVAAAPAASGDPGGLLRSWPDPKSVLMGLHTWKTNLVGFTRPAVWRGDQASCSSQPHHGGDTWGQWGSCLGIPCVPQLTADRGAALSIWKSQTRIQQVTLALKPKNCLGSHCSALTGFVILSFFLGNTWAGKILYKGLHVQINNLTAATGAPGTIANITRFVLKLQKLPML